MPDKRDRKRLQFTVDGIDYTLEYTPQSIRQMEDDGIDFDKMDTRIVNTPYDLFRGAFIARHNYVPMKKRDEIYDLLADTDENGTNLITALAEMLKNEIEWMSKKPKGNVRWAMV